MALKKEIMNAIGQVCEYHRITRIEGNVLQGSFAVEISSYINEKTRAEFDPVSSEWYSLQNGENALKSGGNILSESYKQIVEFHPNLMGAENIFEEGQQ